MKMKPLKKFNTKMKYALIGIVFLVLFASLSFALQIEVEPSQVVSVEQGDVADYKVTLINDRGTAVDLRIRANADVPVSLQDGSLRVSGHSEKVTHIFAMTRDVPPGFYPIDIEVRDGSTTYISTLGLRVEEGTESFYMDSFIEKITVEQGTEAEYKFLVRNNGDNLIKNIFLTGDIPTHLSPEYPAMFNLYPTQTTAVHVKITIPSDYAPGNYYFTIEGRTGELAISKQVALEVLEKTSLAGALTMEVLLPWEPLKDGDRTIGYTIPVRVKNTDVEAIDNVVVGFEGLPGGWEATGDTTFTIGALETKDIKLNIIPKDFGEHQLTILLTHDSEKLASTSIAIAGYKVGIGSTGMFLADGSIMVGILFAVIIVLVLLYIREKNKKADTTEEKKDKEYLRKLAAEARNGKGEKELPMPPSMKNGKTAP